MLTGRLVLGATFVVAAAAMAVVWAADGSRELWRDVWSRAGVPPLLPTFADLRAYTAAWECDGSGVDVFVSNPCDPWGRTLVPPRLPAELGFLGLGQSATVPLALAVIGVFLACVLVVAGRLRLFEVPVYAAIVLSPAVLLGVERANTDLVIFALLTLVLVTVRAAGPLRAVAYGALLLAAAIKLYPIFAAGVLFRQGRRRALEGCLAVLLPFAVYLLLIRDELELAVDNMTRVAALSWGASVLPMELGIAGRSQTLFVGLGLALALALSVALALLLRRRPPVAEEDGGRALDAFWIGAGAYVGTFAVGSNFNYKLVCLIFVVPQLLAWVREPRARIPGAAQAVVGVVLMFWVGVETAVVPDVGDRLIWARQVWFPVDEALGWALFVYLATALWLTLPRGLVAVGRRARAAAVPAS